MNVCLPIKMCSWDQKFTYFLYNSFSSLVFRKKNMYCYSFQIRSQKGGNLCLFPTFLVRLLYPVNDSVNNITLFSINSFVKTLSIFFTSTKFSLAAELLPKFLTVYCWSPVLSLTAKFFAGSS